MKKNIWVSKLDITLISQTITSSSRQVLLFIYLGIRSVCKHWHTQTHSHTHRHTHTHIDTYVYMNTHTHRNTHRYAHKHSHTHLQHNASPHRHIDMHTYIQASTHSQTNSEAIEKFGISMLNQIKGPVFSLVCCWLLGKSIFPVHLLQTHSTPRCYFAWPAFLCYPWHICWFLCN